MNEKYVKVAKWVGVAIVIAIITVILIRALQKYIKSSKKKEERQKLITEVMQESPTTPDKVSYGQKAIELEKLIFAKHNVIYGWEADIEGILKMFASYSKNDVDKVLQAYSIIFQPGSAGGSIIGNVIPVVNYIATPEKQYTGSAFNDLKNIENEEDYNKIVFAYNQLK